MTFWRIGEEADVTVRQLRALQFELASQNSTSFENITVTAVSAAEAWLDFALRCVLTNRLAETNFIEKRNKTRTLEQGPNTWEERKSSWSGLLEISLSDCPNWNDFNTAVAARNSILDGNGYLTALQRKNLTTFRKITQGGYEIEGGAVICNSTTAEKAVLGAISLVFHNAAKLKDL